MLGGAALLADGLLTPAVTVTTAVEGLRSIAVMNRFLGSTQVKVVIITLIIISALFSVQRAGTSRIGRTFGPVMLHKSIPAKSELSNFDEAILRSKYAIRRAAGSVIEWYGLDTSILIIENVPLITGGGTQARRIVRQATPLEADIGSFDGVAE